MKKRNTKVKIESIFHHYSFGLIESKEFCPIFQNKNPFRGSYDQIFPKNCWLTHFSCNWAHKLEMCCTNKVIFWHRYSLDIPLPCPERMWLNLMKHKNSVALTACNFFFHKTGKLGLLVQIHQWPLNHYVWGTFDKITFMEEVLRIILHPISHL